MRTITVSNPIKDLFSIWALEMFILYRRILFCVAVYIFIRIMLQGQRTVFWKQEVVTTPDITFGKSKERQEYQCHYLKDYRLSPVVTEISTFPVNSIFFIDSSCSGMTLRKACSVESAARANPERQIVVLSTSPLNPENVIIKKLLSLNNTSVLRIHLETYAEATPLDGKFRKKPLSFEDLNIDLAVILKFLTLYKYSGIYLSMDVIVARKFEGLLNNWIVKENPTTMSSDMFCFSENFNGRAMAHVALNVIVNNLAMMEGEFSYRFDDSFVMKQFVNMWCGVTDILFLNASNCQELDIGLPENFFPIPFRIRQNYFKPGTLEKWKHKVYTYQIWESYTKNYAIKKNSLYEKLAKTYCPMTYKYFGIKFGEQ